MRTLNIKNTCWGAIMALSLSIYGPAFAAHPVLGGGAGKGGGPINTATGTTMGKGQWAAGFQFDMTKFDSYSDNELVDFAEEDREVHNVDEIVEFIASLSTGISDHVTAHARIPYIVKNGIKESEPPDEAHSHGNSKGFGDISLHIHHMAVHMPDVGFHLAVIYGLKLPTGQTGVEDQNGERFELEFQPGTGSWDPMLGVGITEDYGPFSFHGNVNYTLVTEGAQNTDLGDRFNYNAALVYRTKPPLRLSCILELNGLWQDKEEIDGDEDDDSGGSVLLVSPGARYDLSPMTSAYISYGLPIYQNLNGEQNEIEHRFVLGLSSAF